MRTTWFCWITYILLLSVYMYCPTKNNIWILYSLLTTTTDAMELNISFYASSKNCQTWSLWWMLGTGHRVGSILIQYLSCLSVRYVYWFLSIPVVFSFQKSSVFVLVWDMKLKWMIYEWNCFICQFLYFKFQTIPTLPWNEVLFDNDLWLFPNISWIHFSICYYIVMVGILPDR